jgi:hypothetical protein
MVKKRRIEGMKNIIRIIRELLDKCDEEDFPTS